MSKEEMKVSAANFGFDATWIADILQTWGEDVLALAIEAARNGLSVAFVVELLKNLGPKFLDFIVGLLNRRKMMGMAAGDIVPGPLVEGMDSAFVDLIIEKYLPQLIEKFLPIIMEKYGDQLIKWIADFFLKSLQK